MYNTYTPIKLIQFQKINATIMHYLFLQHMLCLINKYSHNYLQKCTASRWNAGHFYCADSNLLR